MGFYVTHYRPQFGADEDPQPQRLAQAVATAGKYDKRRDMAQALGLTPATITNASQELIGLGLIAECDDAKTEQRSVPLCIDPTGAYAIGINMGRTGLGVGVADLGGRIQRYVSQPWLVSEPDTVVAFLAETINTIMRQTSVDPTRMIGVGIGVAGMVDVDQSIVRSHTGLNWRQVALGPRLADRLGWEIQVANNVQALALAESMYGVATAVDNFALVYVSTVTGAGIVMGGELYQGERSTAGALAHLPVVPGGPLCSCGGRGCLEAVASNFAVWQDAQRSMRADAPPSLQRRLDAPFQSRTIAIIWAEAEQGDSLACELLRRQAHHVGLATASLFAILDPALVALSTPGCCQAMDLGEGSFLDMSGAQLRNNPPGGCGRAHRFQYPWRAPLIQGAAALVFAGFIEHAASAR